MLGMIFHWFLGWGGIGVVVTVVAIAVAIIEPAAISAFVPRRYAIEIAVVAAFLTFSSAKFYNDGASYVQGKWDAAVQAAIKRGENARSDAERDIGNGGGGSGGVSDDQLDRDRSPM